jgi:hypothetical protein
MGVRPVRLVAAFLDAAKGKARIGAAQQAACTAGNARLDLTVQLVAQIMPRQRTDLGILLEEVAHFDSAQLLHKQLLEWASYFLGHNEAFCGRRTMTSAHACGEPPRRQPIVNVDGTIPASRRRSPTARRHLYRPTEQLDRGWAPIRF